MKEEKTLKDKALEVIEWLVSDDFMEDAEYKLYSKVEFSQEDARFMAKKLLSIYRYAHSVQPHTCYVSHENWRKELIDAYEEMKHHANLQR